MAGLEHNSTLWLSIYKGLTRHQTQYINKSINMSEKADFEAEVKALEEFQKVSPPLVSSGLADQVATPVLTYCSTIHRR
jgi:hypothetical protein